MKVFIVTFRLMLLYFGLQAVTRLFWLLSSITQYTGNGMEMTQSYTLQIWGVIGHVLFLGLLIAAWLLPRKCLGILPSDVGGWPDDVRALNEKLPQLLVFGIGLFWLLSSITVVGGWLFHWLINYGTDLTVVTFGPPHFWALLGAALALGIPLAMMFYSKHISQFFIK